MKPKNTPSKRSSEAKIAAAAPAGGCMTPSLHMEAIARAVANGTRQYEVEGMNVFITRAIDMDIICP